MTTESKTDEPRKLEQASAPAPVANPKKTRRRARLVVVRRFGPWARVARIEATP